MVQELTNEQIVTKLLTSNTVLKPISTNFNNNLEEFNLGEFLINNPSSEENTEFLNNTKTNDKDEKYVFINNKKTIF